MGQEHGSLLAHGELMIERGKAVQHLRYLRVLFSIVRTKTKFFGYVSECRGIRKQVMTLRPIFFVFGRG